MGPGRKPRRPVFSERGSNVLSVIFSLFSELPCANPVFDMINPYIFVTSNIEGDYSPFQAVQGTDNYYTLQGATEETLIVTIRSWDEPEITQMSLHATNVDSINITIWKKDGSGYIEFTDLDMVRIYRKVPKFSDARKLWFYLPKIALRGRGNSS